jgi:hypothetical protein
MVFSPEKIIAKEKRLRKGRRDFIDFFTVERTP